ncbi:MAG: 4Fe-4S dicluster domain-containing protein, partial [Clostridia bacterium]|nr:4Fe-4S dicluster domain-containing protein [Clostridia bacterium]
GGARILMAATGAEKIIFAFSQKSEAEKLISTKTAKMPFASVKILSGRFPQDDPGLIVSSLSGFRPTAKYLPFAAETCLDVFTAFVTGRPKTHKRLTVSGDCIASPGEVCVPIGTVFSDVMDFCGGFREKPDAVISGGVMRGKPVALPGETPVCITTGGILAVKRREEVRKYPCIRCGKCADVCPKKLLPLYLLDASVKGNEKAMKKYGADICIRCGACEYICPSGIKIISAITAKSTATEAAK